MSGQLQVIALTPPGFPDGQLPLVASRAGFIGGTALEYAGSAAVEEALRTAGGAGVEFCASVGAVSTELADALRRSRPGLTRIILCDVDTSRLAGDVAGLHEAGFKILVQATCLAEAQLAEGCGADAIIVKGSEAGGRVGEETTFVLLQRILPRVKLPVWARGGIGPHTAAACLVAGAVGVVLDWQLALCEESALPEDVKAKVARMDGSETAVLGQDRTYKYRAYFRPGETAFAELKEFEESLAVDGADAVVSESLWRDAVERRAAGSGGSSRLLLMGQDAAFAVPLAQRFHTVGQVCSAIRQAASAQARVAARLRALRPDGPLAASHGTRYPIVQGPMTRVSDTADFALAVANGGGLPFLALALLRGPQAGELLEETRRKLGTLPWGVGILGFVPKELREEQLVEVRKHPPPYAIIAGGRPDQAAALERDGIQTYLHIPSPALLKMFLEAGVRGVILEGRECGGHVGPRTSFVLWESMIRVILDHLAGTGERAEGYHVLFAGGIHDSLSAAMVAAMAAPLSERGVRIGVLLGTGYLFTKEAVASGAIVPGFQEEAIRCQETILLETGVGHATRCAETPFGLHFAQEKRRMIREGRPREEIREALELLNLGRLRIASKGIARAEQPNGGAPASRFAELDAEAQRSEGMYMIGQVAALRDRTCTIAELHDDVSRAGVERLESLAGEAEKTALRQRGGRPDIAIVGMSCLFPKAGDLRKYWENILNKVNAVGEIPRERWDWELYFDSDRTARDKIYSRWGAFLDEIPLDPVSYGMPPNSVPSVEPMQLLVLDAVRQALRDAGYDNRPFDRERTSVVLGAGGGVADLGLGYGFRSLLPHFLSKAGGESSEARQLIDKLEGVLPEWTEDSFAGLLANVTAGRVANRFDFGGTNYTVDAACASSLAAVRLAVTELETGSSDMVVAGGADTMQSPFAYLCFSKTQALSPTGQCKTFDESADGIVIGEGIAVAVLKRLEDAVRDGDRVYAVIKGVGSSSDGKDKGLTAPRPAGQIRALERAYAQAGYSPRTVGLIEAHGTGTVAGDQSEVESLTRTFAQAGATVQSCALGSVKSMIGHTKCTAGVAGLLKAALALHCKVLPPTLGVKRPNPKAKFEQSPFYINSEPRPWLARHDGTPRRAGVSAFGFGGTNFHATLEEYVPREGSAEDAPALQTWPAELFVWRAQSAGAIASAIAQVASALEQGARPEPRDLAAAVCEKYGRGAGTCVLAIVASSIDDLTTKLSTASAAIAAGKSELRDPKGLFYATAPLAVQGKIAFVFPGQGSQSVNMLRDLSVALPSVRATFERADAALGDSLGRLLSGFIFPRPAFTPEEAAADEAALTRTNVAQPAIGAADLAMFTLLSELGVRLDMVCGHSYGEYVALCAAGVIRPDDLIRISEARGRLILEAAKDSTGTMAAIDADERGAAAIVDGLDGAWIANLNSPMQTVIAGTETGVEAVLRRCEERGVKGRRIKVSCAFHSKLVSGAQEPFRAVLEGVEFATPCVTAYSNTTAAPHSGDGAAIRSQLVEHLVRPVRFADEIVAMYDAGARVFVEVGPGKVLTGLIERTLADRPHFTVNTDQAGRNGLLQLVHALGQLASTGADMDYTRLFRQRTTKTLDLDQLVQQTKPAPLPLTTWMINGTRATPVKESSKRPAVTAKPAPAIVNGSATSNAGDAVQTATVPASRGGPVAPAAGLSSVAAAVTPPGPATAAVPPAVESVTIPAIAVGDGVESVMGAYQALMARFLDTQRNVMLAYLQGAPAAVPNVGATAPVTSAQIPSAAAPVPAAPVAASPPTPPGAASPVVAPTATAASATIADGVTSAGTPPTGTPAEPEAQVAGPVRAEGLTRDELTKRLVGIVSDRTGYPPEMLDLSLDLEADLGIDSIKRIEILSSLQKDSLLPGGSADSDMEALAKLKTLSAIIDWILDRPASLTPAAETAGPVAAEPTAGATPAEAPLPEAVSRMLLSAFECPLGPATPSSASDGVALITDDERGIAAAFAEALNRQGSKAVIVSASGGGEANGLYPRVDLTDPGAVGHLVERLRREHGRIAALIHLLPLGGGCTTDRCEPATWSATLDRGLLSLFNLAQKLESDLRSGGSGRVLAATRMGGAFAVAEPEMSEFRPDHGAVCGVVKTLSREWPDVACKTVDFEREAPPEAVVASILAELGAGDGVVEVGYQGGRRQVLRPVITPVEPSGLAMELGPDSVVLITGGARGITAEIAVELADRFRPKVILLGRSPLPSDVEPEATAGISGVRELKAALRAQMERAGEKPAPAAIEAAHTRLTRDRDIRATLARLRRTATAVEYHAVDVSDVAAFSALIDDVYSRYGRIDGVIHGAGVTEDKLIRDKTLESFQRVLRPKVNGAFALASKLRREGLKFVCFFSSVSARYGNRGQADYAAANEVLNKVAQWLNARWGARVVSLNWGPWESSGGMVSPELAKQFAKAGVQMISRPAGRAAFMTELRHGRKEDVEVVFGGPLHAPEATPQKPKRLAPPLPLLEHRARLARNSDGSVEVERQLDPSYDLYLLDHQLDGKPVMPMAMLLELLAEVATAGWPDLHLTAVEELRVLRGITLEDGPQMVRVLAAPRSQPDGSLRVDLRAAVAGGRMPVNYTATAVMQPHTATPSALPALELREPREFSMTVDEAYAQWLFHGPLFAGIVEVERIGENGIIGRLSPSSPQRCLAGAPSGRWIIDPVIVDSGLQLIILWARSYLDMTPLPARLGCYHWFGELSGGEVRCEIEITHKPGVPALYNDVRFYDARGRLLARMMDTEAACSKELNRLSGARGVAGGERG